MKQTKVISFDLSLATEDNVYNRDGKKVRIICTNRKHDEYPIIALTLSDNTGIESFNSYTVTGLYNGGHSSNLDLVLHIEEEVDPCEDLNPFDQCLVRNSLSSNWTISFFDHLRKEDSTYPYLCMNGTFWKYCIPYKGNEHLLKPTNNSK